MQLHGDNQGKFNLKLNSSWKFLCRWSRRWRAQAAARPVPAGIDEGRWLCAPFQHRIAVEGPANTRKHQVFRIAHCWACITYFCQQQRHIFAAQSSFPLLLSTCYDPCVACWYCTCAPWQVLSIGGNDARIRFLESRNPDVITSLMITDGFVANLRRVIETIREEITPNIIVVYV